MNKVLLYCRSGFEKDCAKEITDKAVEHGVYGFTRIENNSGYVLFECYKVSDADKLARVLPFSELIFARQMIVTGELLCNLSPNNRILPIARIIKSRISEGKELRVEVPDTNEAKKLLKFCRKFTIPLRATLHQQNSLIFNRKSTKQSIIHIFFISSNHCYVGYSYLTNNSPFFMGIPRLKFPSDAPSRSTLKLEEAFHVFIPANEWESRLAGGMYAVDLGACPGGWTYQLIKRSMIVSAVDNGPIAPSIMNSGKVVHYREDGFKYRPTKRNIRWLVCDILEKPARISNLITKWLINKWCYEVIFNLKLPMRKRYEEISQNLRMIRENLQGKNINAQIQARQLYHDRKEVTVHVRRI